MLLSSYKVEVPIFLYRGRGYSPYMLLYRGTKGIRNIFVSSMRARIMYVSSICQSPTSSPHTYRVWLPMSGRSPLTTRHPPQVFSLSHYTLLGFSPILLEWAWPENLQSSLTSPFSWDSSFPFSSILLCDNVIFSYSFSTFTLWIWLPITCSFHLLNLSFMPITSNFPRSFCVLQPYLTSCLPSIHIGLNHILSLTYLAGYLYMPNLRDFRHLFYLATVLWFRNVGRAGLDGSPWSTWPQLSGWVSERSVSRLASWCTWLLTLHTGSLPPGPLRTAWAFHSMVVTGQSLFLQSSWCPSSEPS